MRIAAMADPGNPIFALYNSVVRIAMTKQYVLSKVEKVGKD
jgi:hypothetical protein